MWFQHRHSENGLWHKVELFILIELNRFNFAWIFMLNLLKQFKICMQILTNESNNKSFLLTLSWASCNTLKASTSFGFSFNFWRAWNLLVTIEEISSFWKNRTSMKWFSRFRGKIQWIDHKKKNNKQEFMDIHYFFF